MAPIDFLIGFTVFILALILVVNMLPGITLGLEAQAIDYNAVAYRTGVILVEDAGYCDNTYDDSLTDRTRWEQKKLSKKDEIQRFGLAVSPNSYNILSINKIERFFNDPKYYNFTPSEYRDRLFFTDIPYQYNISIRSVDSGINYCAGDSVPEGEYGHIRRLVKIKGHLSPAIIDFSNPDNPDSWIVDNLGLPANYTVEMNFTELLNRSIPPAYRLDPSSEPVMINITNFGSTLTPGNTSANLTKIELFRGGIAFPLEPVNVDGNQPSCPCDVSSNISLVVNPEDYHGKITKNDLINIKCSFNNQTNISGTFNYDYSSVTLPPLTHGAVEVAVW